MNTLEDILSYVRRIIKTPSNQVITDSLIIDYINRFWLMDMDARLQLFDLKTTYTFQTIPGIDKYNMPLYAIQNGSSGYPVSYYPVYQGFMQPLFINGINSPLYTQPSLYYNLWPRYVQQTVQVGTGNGNAGPYTLQAPFFPTLPGHIDMSGIISLYNAGFTNYGDPPFVPTSDIYPTLLPFIQSIPVTSVNSTVYFTATGQDGRNIIVADSGFFLNTNTNGELYGLLMEPGKAPKGNLPLTNGVVGIPAYSTTQNTINYSTGLATNVYFNEAIPNGTPINAQCFYIEQGTPRAALFYNNTITMTPPPYTQAQVNIETYLTPAAFLNTADAIPFAYMAEYLARGAARKILSDTGDVEQLNFYEPLFREQETLVWKRSQRIWTSTRTDTIFSNSGFQQNYNQSALGV